jgi:hypothetical protein
VGIRALPTKLLAFPVHRVGVTHRDWDAFYISSQSLHAEIIKISSGRSKSKQINGTPVSFIFLLLPKAEISAKLHKICHEKLSAQLKLFPNCFFFVIVFP